MAWFNILNIGGLWKGGSPEPISDTNKMPVKDTDVHTRLDTLNAALDTVEAKLQAIIDNTDTLEANTDGLEGLLSAVDATLATPRQEDGHGSGPVTPTHITGTVTSVPSGTQKVDDDETQAKLDLVVVELQDIEADVVSVKAAVDAAEAARDIDATALQARADLLATEAKLEAVRALLASIDGKDFATQTTLAAILAAILPDNHQVQVSNQVEVTLNGEAIALDAATLAALETITVLQGSSPWVVSGTVTSTPSGTQDVNVVSSVQLEVTLNGEAVALDAATLAALENVTVDNMPSDFPDAAAHTKLDAAIVELQDIEADVEAVKASVDAAEAARDVDATALQARADLLATEAKQDQQIARVGEVSATPTANTVLARLKDITDAVAGLDGNTDQIEAKLDAVKASIDAAEAARDADALALQSRADLLGTEATLATLLTEATFAAEDFATQATLEAARVLLASIDTEVDVALSTRASEATVATLLTEATFAAEDFATQATLEAARVLLASLDGKDFATETTLAAAKTTLDAVDANTAVEPITADTITLSASGAVRTPAAGKAMRLWYFSLGVDPAAADHQDVALRWGPGGANFFRHRLNKNGQIFAHSYRNGRSYIEGPVDVPLYATLLNADETDINFDFQDVTP